MSLMLLLGPTWWKFIKSLLLNEIVDVSRAVAKDDIWLAGAL